MKQKQWIVSVGLAVLVAGGAFTFVQHSRRGTVRADRRLARSHADAPKSVAGIHLTDKTADSEYQAAVRLYDAGAYDAATMGFYKATAAQPDAAAPHFYLGICYWMTGDVRVAIQELRIAATLRQPEFVEPAHLYLAKAYLRQGDSINATRELDQVLNGNGAMKPQAQQLKLSLTSTSN